MIKAENIKHLHLVIPDIELKQYQGYNGNINLKKSGVKFAMTQEMLEEWRRCRDDIVYFCRKYVKIINVDEGLVNFKPYAFQEEILHSFSQPENRFNICLIGRQSGKTTVNAALILHYILFNKNKKVAIIANKAATAREVLDRIQNSFQYLPKWIQQGVIEWNKGSSSFENGCKVFTGSTTASSIRGQSINLLFIDEVAFIDTNLYDEFFNSVYPTISSGKTTKICMVSTPKGMNHFYHLVKNARANPDKFNLKEYDWRAVPTRDQEWADMEIARIGPERFSQEYAGNFLGSELTLISMGALASLEKKDPIIQTIAKNVKIYEEPKKDKIYFVTVDVSEGLKLDYSTVSVIDVTQIPYRQVAVFRSNVVSPLMFPAIIIDLAKKYNEAYVLIEINSVGYSVASDVIYDLEYENVLYVKTDEEKSGRMGIRTTTKTKRLGCLRLKDIIESGILEIHDADTIQELYTFVEKGKSYEADSDTDTDDIVMGLVNFSYYSILPEFENITDKLFKAKFREIRRAEVEEDSIASMFVDFGEDEDSLLIDRGFSDSVLTYKGDYDTRDFFF